jgi:uncharacterized membrane-anchored protein
MKKSILVAIFIVVACVQLVVPASQLIMREFVLQTGTEFRFITAPVDPADPFRGRYVALDFIENSITVDTAADFIWGQTVYVQVSEDTNGFAHVTGITPDKPAGKNYIKVRVRRVRGSTVRFTYPFDRYYMKETQAPEAETAYRESTRRTGNTPTYVTVRVKWGLAVIDELYIEGIPVREYLQQPGEKGPGIRVQDSGF